VATTLWYSNDMADRIRSEEQRKLELWSKAIQQRAELVRYTEALFRELEEDEKTKADQIAEAYRLVDTAPEGTDFGFISRFIWSNKTIPVLIYKANDSLLYRVNVAPGVDADSLRQAMAAENRPFQFSSVEDHTIYWSKSLRYYELRDVMDDLMNSFISETVMNSASVPVLIVDSTRLEVIRSGGISADLFDTPDRLATQLAVMAAANAPIAVDLPGNGRQFIYFEHSVVLTQLRFFPIIQLLLIAAFLLTSYVVFSSFRRAEQNQVWAGMAKETAHQLGTPLSSLMAWMTILESEGLKDDTLEEMNKDVNRLHVVVDRFSKIGSKPALEVVAVSEVVNRTVDYMRPRISKKVDIRLDTPEDEAFVSLNRPLFSWVIENLMRNAVDAMDGDGELVITVHANNPDEVTIDVRDTGKGIPKRKWREVFAPGYTTKKRGWGLGLSLTKRIIESYHDGRIFVASSTLGGGTTMRVTLARKLRSGN
jgi:two-component system, sporulation sensor kinase D